MTSLTWTVALVVAAATLCRADIIARSLPFSKNATSLVTDVTTLAHTTALTRVDDHIAVVFVYDSLDSNSVKHARAVEEAAAELEGFAVVYGVDMRNEETRWLLDTWNVQVVPAIKLFSAASNPRKSLESTVLAKIGGMKGKVDYPENSEMTAAAIKRAALQHLPNGQITKVTAEKKVEALRKKVDDGKAEVPQVVLLTDKAKSSQLYKAVSLGFTGRADFFEIDTAKMANAMELFDVEAVPALLVFPAGGEPRDVFDGELDIAAINEFVARHTVTRDERNEQRAASDADRIAAEYKRKTHVLDAVDSAAAWEQSIMKRQSTSAVFFIDAAAAGSKEAAVRKFLKKFPRTSVSLFAWVDKHDAAGAPSALYTAFAGAGATGDELFFMQAKKKTFYKFVGEQTPEGLNAFIAGPLAKSTGGQKLKAFPDW
jgi:hypothetical protein